MPTWQQSGMEEETSNNPPTRRRHSKVIHIQPSPLLMETIQKIPFCQRNSHQGFSINFSQQWQLFKAKLHPHVSFKFFIPAAITSDGNRMLGDGHFYIQLLSLLRNCRYVCFPVLLRQSYQNLLTRITQNRQQLETYLEAALADYPAPRHLQMKMNGGCDRRLLPGNLEQVGRDEVVQWEYKMDEQPTQNFDGYFHSY